MKQNVLKLALIAPFFVLSAHSCKKNNLEDQLPTETQTGRGVFGCLIDGKPVFRYNATHPERPRAPSVYYESVELFMLATTTTSPEYRVNFFITRPRFGIGTFVIDSAIFYPTDPSIQYYYKAVNVEQITFTKFTEEFSPAVASGTFEFDADTYQKNTHLHIPNQKIQIRKGRFDVRYHPFPL